jgi:hypothetical protein
LAKAHNPSYTALRGHVPNQMAARFKAICSHRGIDFGSALEEALEPWIEKEEERLNIRPPGGLPPTIAEVVQQNYWQLKKKKIRNMDGIAEGNPPTKDDLARISSALDIDQGELVRIALRQFPDLDSSKNKEPNGGKEE